MFANLANLARVITSLFLLVIFLVQDFFYLIYSYVWSSPILSTSGYCYFLLFLDDYSKFMWIYFMKQKSKVFTIFQQFKNLIETQFNTKIKQLLTDWGGEYHNVSTFIESLGIIHCISCPHTQAQNDTP